MPSRMDGHFPFIWYNDDMPDHGHTPVLLEPVLQLLNPQPGEIVLDCTVGRGGHSAAFADAVGPEGKIIGFDLDPENIKYSSQRLESSGVPFLAIHDSFVRAPAKLAELGVRADVIFADLGFSTRQMDNPDRGFSFQTDGPLDMRLNPASPVTAADLIASMSEGELAAIIAENGEEPLAGKIARKLVQNRRTLPIQTTARLAQLVEEAYGSRARTSRLHPATRTFMALRIAVNDELAALRSLLDDISRGAERIESDGWINAAARVGVISFHSLEDRLVKQAFATLEKRGKVSRLTKRPITAGEEEVQANPRARSAKLRVARMAHHSEV